MSPVFGLGVDRVLQFKLVTPDGVIRTANDCQNSELFWALRGGGGGTFGAILEVTYKAEKQLSIQVYAFLSCDLFVPAFIEYMRTEPAWHSMARQLTFRTFTVHW